MNVSQTWETERKRTIKLEDCEHERRSITSFIPCHNLKPENKCLVEETAARCKKHWQYDEDYLDHTYKNKQEEINWPHHKEDSSEDTERRKHREAVNNPNNWPGWLHVQQFPGQPA